MEKSGILRRKNLDISDNLTDLTGVRNRCILPLRQKKTRPHKVSGICEKYVVIYFAEIL